jgi:hypothetical protein
MTRGVKLTAYLHLMPSLCMGGVVPLLPLYAVAVIKWGRQFLRKNWCKSTRIFGVITQKTSIQIFSGMRTSEITIRTCFFKQWVFLVLCSSLSTPCKTRSAKDHLTGNQLWRQDIWHLTISWPLDCVHLVKCATEKQRFGNSICCLPHVKRM